VVDTSLTAKSEIKATDKGQPPRAAGKGKAVGGLLQ